MISKINKIKNLGLVFSNYTWDCTLSNFKRYNLIYGWNGSGKTTLSRLFDNIVESSITDLEYEIEDDQNQKYKQGEIFPKKIRIFNQDYKENNIKILEGRANSISISLGEENKKLVEDIENDKKLLNGDSSNPGKITLLEEYRKDKGRKTTERNSKFTEIAKTIGAAIGGSALRDYRKPQAESDFSKITTKAELSEDDLAKYSLSAKQESLPSLEALVVKTIKPKGSDENFEVSTFLESILTEGNTLLGKTVESEVISRLAENEDISEWVEKGIHIHTKHSSNVCEYCRQTVPEARIEELAHHFNEADKKLKSDLDNLMEKLEMIYPILQPLQTSDKARLYTELQNTFETKKINFESAKNQILANIKKLSEELKNKKSKTTEIVSVETKPDIKDFIKHINEINSVIATHNKTTTDFEEVKKEATQKLKLHYLSTIFDEVNKYDGDIKKLSEDITSLEKEVDEIQKRIAENMANVSSKHKACEIINEKLTTFLGYKELTFVPHTKVENTENGGTKEVVLGYNIMRGDKPATSLSEGEKTAIAFVYFVVHLGDENFNVTDGIIVIDDPISSLDSNSLYQAFSFLKNAVKEAHQVFLFTHNFSFLRLLINWTSNANKNSTRYYMIKNIFTGDIRSAYIGKMDKELYEYESEYHYLFKLLKQLQANQDDSIERAYPIPNIARKVWEAFLMFSVPNSKSPYLKMDELKAAGHDVQKLDAIYKFTNDQSHITGSGFDPALVPETKKVVKELFEMMEAVSPNHFKIINEATN